MSNPFDVVKTRMMEQHQGKQLYKSSMDCFIKVELVCYALLIDCPL